MRHGSPQEGFEIQVYPDENLFSLKVWGFWKQEELSQTFRREMQSALEAFAGKEWALLADFLDSVAQRPEVCRLYSELLTIARERGLERVAVVVGNALARLQLGRLAQGLDIAIWSFHKEIPDAMDSLTGSRSLPLGERAN